MTKRRVRITDLMAEFAQPHKTLMAWLSDAGVPRASDKTFPYAEAVAAIKLRTDEPATLRDRYDARGVDTDDARRELIESKREAERERARRLRLQNEKLAGNLVSRDDIEDAGRDLVVRARTALLAIGTKVAPRLVNEPSAATIAATIDQEIRAALVTLADPDAFINDVLGI